MLAVATATGHDDLMSIRSSWPNYPAFTLCVEVLQYARNCVSTWTTNDKIQQKEKGKTYCLCAWICWAGWFIFRGRNLPLFPDVDNVTIALWQHDSWWFWVAATWQHADFVASSNCGWRCSKGEEFTFISSRRLSRPEVAPTFSVLETPQLTYHQTDG